MRETHKRRVIVSETDKIAAVEKYLKKEFDSATIESGHDAGRKARVFKIKSANHSSTAIVENEFLEKHSAEAIPGLLRTYTPGRTPQGVQLSHRGHHRRSDGLMCDSGCGIPAPGCS